MSKRKLMMIAMSAGIVGMMTGCSVFSKGETLPDGERQTDNMAVLESSDEDKAIESDTSSEKQTEKKTETETTLALAQEKDTTESETNEKVTERETEKETEKKTETETEKETEKKPSDSNAGAGGTVSDYVMAAEYETNSNGEISYSARVDFENAAFLGDSRTAGLNEKLVVGQADFYTSVGIDVRGVLQKKLFTLKNGQKGTMLEAVSEKNYDKIYLMFGINELGWPYKDTFEQYYTTIIETLKQRFPNAQIYVQSIIPMVDKRTDEVYNNQKIALFNTYIQEVAENTGVSFINVNPSVTDSKGALPEEASSDGIHLSREYLFKWADYLKQKTYS